MKEKMKKMLFLMLFLIILGAASVNSQVRIGGNGQPNGAAVLDLNATDAINNGTKTLALPRVSLTSTTDKLGYSTLLNGMLVYNTTATPGAGVYYWDTNKWVKVSGGEDGVIGNEITDTIANGGLTRSGAGTAENPYKVGIKTNGIVNSMIADGAVSLSKISTTAADSGRFLMSDGSSAISAILYEKEFNDTVALRLRAPKNVSWANILDTSLMVNFVSNTYTRVSTPGLQSGDLCVPKSSATLTVMYADANRLTIVSLHTLTRRHSVAIRCYRPTF